MYFDKIYSWAKVNLSLNIVGRFPNKYHRIESLITFINLFDEINIGISKNNKHKIIFSGKFSQGIGKKNTVSELLRLLEKKKINKKL